MKRPADWLLHLYSWRGATLSVLVLVALGWILFFYRLGDRDLWSSHEGRAAQNAQSVLDVGCWTVPRHFDLRLELQKPPLYYWLVALAGYLHGGRIDPWVVRVPAAAAGLGGVLVLYFLGVWRQRPMAGLAGALMLATALHYTWLARIGRIDMPLSFVIAIALGSTYLGVCRRRARGGCAGWGWFLLTYLGIALALLLKGPVGAVLPLAVAGAYLALEGELPPLRQGRAWLRLAHELGLGWGALLVIGLAAPWFAWANYQTRGSLLRTFFWHHNVERALGSGALRAHPWWFYGPRLATDFLPWSLLLPIALWFLSQRGSSTDRSTRAGWFAARCGDPEARFGLTWLVTMLLVLSLARFKRADYLLPAYPGAALLLGCAAENLYRRSRYPLRWATAGATVVLACAAGWSMYVGLVLPAQESAREFQRFAAAVRGHAPAPQLVLFFRVESHALAFHIGSPIDTFLEWENLEIWAGRPGCNYIVMPAECALEWSEHLTAGRLEEVVRSTDFPGAAGHERPLVLMRTHPGGNQPPAREEMQADVPIPGTLSDRRFPAQSDSCSPF
jgi:4-amino-4-deoxy-L-arabinose transferase-like glycosyltransferase